MKLTLLYMQCILGYKDVRDNRRILLVKWFKERHCEIHFQMFGLSTYKGRTSGPSRFTTALVDTRMEMGENNYKHCF